MKCIYCGHDKTRVIDSAKTKGKVLRKRVCQLCNYEFYTEETAGAFEKQNEIRGQLNRLREIKKKLFS